LSTIEMSPVKGNYWRPMEEAPMNGEMVRLIGHEWSTSIISGAVGRYVKNRAIEQWLTDMGVYFKPIGWMPIGEIPAEETFFVLGKTYLSREDYKVKIIDQNGPFGYPYACVKGDDDIWRYNHPGIMGRVWGIPTDFSDPCCLYLPSVEPDPSLWRSFLNWLF